jgi:hypothetical protein
MLVAIAGLPVMATTCAALCEPDAMAHTTPAEAIAADAAAPSASTHHDSDARCHEPSTADVRLTAAARHDCGTHDGAQRDAEAALTPARTDVGAPVAVTLSIVAPAAARVSRPLSAPSRSGPPLLSSASTTPLVLRV